MATPDYFYTPIGNKVNRASIVNDMIINYQNTTSKITDFTDGSEIRNLLESTALTFYKIEYYRNILYREGFLVYAKGGYLDLHGLENQLQRKIGTPASGFVTLTLESALTQDYIIDDNILFVNPETNMEYSIFFTIDNIDSYSIPAGELEVTVPVVCTVGGKIGNCDKNKVIGFKEEQTTNPLTVTNVEPLTGGTDPESDTDYRARLLANERGGNFGSKGWYNALLQDIDGVHDSYITFAEDAIRVSVNGDNKPIDTGLLTEALEILNNTGNHVLGHSFKVYEPDYNLINLRLTVNSEDTLVNDLIRDRVQKLFDGGDSQGMEFEGYNMGDTVNENEIINAVISVDGVNSVIPELLKSDGSYNRFSKIVNQENEVPFLNSLEIVFR